MTNEQDFIEPESSVPDEPQPESPAPIVPELTDTPPTSGGSQPVEQVKKKPGRQKKEATPVKIAVKRIKETVGKPESASPASSAAPAKKALKSPRKKEAAEAPTKKETPAGTTSQPAIKPIRKKVTPSKSTVTTDVVKVTFQLRYSTSFGDTLSVTGSHPMLGNNVLEKAVPMEYVSDELWQCVLDIPKHEPQDKVISYKYLLRYNDGSFAVEWGDDKTISPASIETPELLLTDSWNYAGFYENVFYTEPFKQVLFKHEPVKTHLPSPGFSTHTFKVKAPFLKQNQILCLCGNVHQLGGWDKENVHLMHKQPGNDWWSIDVDLTSAAMPIAYKYGVYNYAEKILVELEGGNNRVLFQAPGENIYTIVSDCFINLPNTEFRGAGVAIPVFSLRSSKSFGTGEFIDLKPLVDWAKSVGLKLIQILPVNDTIATQTIHDSYPYAAISAFALHPLYLHLPTLIDKKNKSLLQKAEEKAASLNSLKVVDYKEVITSKMEFVKRIFAGQKKQTFKNEEFKSFFAANEHWLVPYAAFSVFRDTYGTSDFSQWPAHNRYVADKINKLVTPPDQVKDEVGIYYFIQYHLHLQLKEATEYAHANGIILKGDIPIGIYRNSCDAWQEPELYNMDQQAGAPPDHFAVKGQNWGFPTYNWERMAKDGFSWWKKRFAQMSHYFDAFRIDHILGFFRIWSIPMDAVEGIMGHFVPARPVHISEFKLNKISFDKQRYTKPFINEQVLTEIFADEAADVKVEYLQPAGDDRFSLLPEFDTQRKVEAHFSGLEENDQNQKRKTGLFDLISNVILFEEKESGGEQFHFRIAMEKTLSFSFLDPETQHRLHDLYIHYFHYRQDIFWKQEAMLKLPELKRSTNMLIFGEDLGMVPSTVPGVMKDLGILSLEIQRMPKNPSKEFFHPNDAPYLSVVTPATHDMSPIRAWWEENQEVTQRFYNMELGQYGKAPAVCEPWIHKTIILQHLYSPAMWSVFQLQDLLGLDEKLRRDNPAEERINVPSNPKNHWHYRMHVRLEDLTKEEDFNSQLKEYVTASGR